MAKKQKVVFIIGTTSSGKSDLAVELAKIFDAEIISADSRQVYKGLDLCTGKITKEEMQGVPHHLLDIKEPKKHYSVAEFQRDCYKKIKEIASHKKNVFIVGGTGFYTRAVAEGFGFSSGGDKNLHNILEEKSVDELQEILKIHNGKIAQTDIQNKRRLVRACELCLTGNEKQANKPKFEVLQILASYPREVLNERIKIRLQKRIDDGMVEEIENLLKNGVDPNFLISLGLECKNTTLYLQGKLTEKEFFDKAYLDIKHFAKRQQTWYKKEKNTFVLDMQNPNYFEIAKNKISQFLHD